MATTNELINGIKASKEAIRQAIIAKGVDVPESTLLNGYAPLVEAISGGGGGFDYEGEMNKILSTVESGYGDICVCVICSASKGYNTFNVATLMGTLNRVEFSDGMVQTDVNYSMEHELTSLLDAGDFQYYWAKCYINSFDDIMFDGDMIAVAYKFFGEIPTITIPDVSLKYFDMGGCSIANIDALIKKSPCIEYIMNAKITDRTLDYTDAKYLKRASFTDLSSVNSYVDVKGLHFLDQNVITDIINLLPEPGFSASVSADYLTEEQKTLCSEKGWYF